MRKYTKILAVLISLAMVIQFAVLPATAATKKVKMSKAKATITVGKTVKLKVSGGKSKSKVAWKSSNKKVATVSKGKVKGIKEGKVTITATKDKKKVKCVVTVKATTVVKPPVVPATPTPLPAIEYPIKIHIAGDSISANGSASGTKVGWGQILGDNFDSTKVIINNGATDGASSKSFLSVFKGMARDFKRGDYVFIQFGHNDEKTDNQGQRDNYYTNPYFDKNTAGSYKYYLKQYVDLAREKGAIPVFLSSICRAEFETDNVTLNNSRLGRYAYAMETLAKEENVIYIDTNIRSKIMFEEYVKLHSKQDLIDDLYDTDDLTHFRMAGAKKITNAIYGEIDANIPDLAQFLKRNIYSSMTITGVGNYNFMSNAGVGATFSEAVNTNIRCWDLAKIELWEAPNGALGAANFASAVKLGTLAEYSRGGTTNDFMYNCQMQRDILPAADDYSICFKPGANMTSDKNPKLVNILQRDDKNLYFIFREGAIRGTDGYSYPASAVQWAGYRGAVSSSFGVGLPS